MLVISSYFLWRFGEELEKFFGRRVFVRMLAILILAEPFLLLLIGLAGPRGWTAEGVNQVQFAVFLAFVTLYPRAKIWLILFTVEAWIIATVIVGVNILQCLAGHNWPALFLVLSETAIAYGLVRYEQGHWTPGSLLPWLKKRITQRSQPELRIVRRSREEPYPSATTPSIDEILDKISSKGMDSLTADERQLLEKASKDLGGGKKKSQA
jgi:hypothetical protein